MFSKSFRICLVILPLLLMVACAGGSGAYSNISVTIQAEYEKKSITTAGLSSATYQPASYCYVEGFDPQTNNIYFSGHLNSDGRGIADVPQNANFMVRLFARYEVPGQNNSGGFHIRGSVKDGSMAAKYSSAASFNAIPDWSVVSDVYSGSRNFSITIRALDSTRDREAGAFNIAAQAVGFAYSMSLLEPGLGLPNLHTFWSPDNTQYTNYPQVAFDNQYRLLAQSSGRTVFHHRVMGYGNSFTRGRGDEYNDSALMNSFAHMLFADYSFPAVNPSHPFDRIVRRDSEDIAWVERDIASETTTAFVGGFCDFISAAFRNDHLLIDISGNSVSACSLNTPTTFSKPNGGEFYRQSVASALYRTWKNSFGGGGTLSALQTMWGATFQPGMAIETTNPSYPYGYLQCPVGNISSYLSGLANGFSFGVTNNVWNSVTNILNSESISNPNASFFNQDKLWKRLTSFPAVETGYIRTYPADRGIYWDADQAVAYHFTQYQRGTRRIVLELTGGQDLYLELFDSQGILEQSYSDVMSNKEINRTLEPGNYLIRVRAGDTDQNRSASFKLTIQ